MNSHTLLPTTAGLHERLRLLHAERALASAEGLDDNQLYRADLDGDIAATHAAYVAAAVTEIASLRGELSGRPQG